MAIDTAGLEVRYTFEINDPDHGTFRDALTVPYDQWGSLTEADLETMKQERYQNWLDAISNPVPPAPVDAPDNQSQTQTLADQLAVLAQQAQTLATATQDQPQDQPQDSSPPTGE